MGCNNGNRVIGVDDCFVFILPVVIRDIIFWSGGWLISFYIIYKNYRKLVKFYYPPWTTSPLLYQAYPTLPFISIYPLYKLFTNSFSFYNFFFLLIFLIIFLFYKESNYRSLKHVLNNFFFFTKKKYINKEFETFQQNHHIASHSNIEYSKDSIAKCTIASHLI